MKLDRNRTAAAVSASNPKAGLRARIARILLSLTGLCAATQAQPAVPDLPAAKARLEQRVLAARTLLQDQESSGDEAPGPERPASGKKFAQYWPNWPNWGNWPKWPNWANWFNR